MKLQQMNSKLPLIEVARLKKTSNNVIRESMHAIKGNHSNTVGLHWVTIVADDCSGLLLTLKQFACIVPVPLR